MTSSSNQKAASQVTSIQPYARTAGILMLVTILAGFFGESYVQSKIIIAGDAAATAKNVAMFSSFFRLGFAAYLVEAFPARIRYTSLSLPYHIGNGVFGGLVPLIGVYICASTQNIYAGLYYPMTVAALTFVIGTLVLKETHGTKIWDEVGGHPATR